MECWSKWDRMLESDLQLLGHSLFQSACLSFQLFKRWLKGKENAILFFCRGVLTAASAALWSCRCHNTPAGKPHGSLLACVSYAGLNKGGSGYYLLKTIRVNQKMNFRLDIYRPADPPRCRSLALSPASHQPPASLRLSSLTGRHSLTLEILLRRPGAQLHGNTSVGSPPSSFVLSSPAAHMRARANKHMVGKKISGDPSCLGDVRGGALWINDRLMLRWESEETIREKCK